MNKFLIALVVLASSVFPPKKIDGGDEHHFCLTEVGFITGFGLGDLRSPHDALQAFPLICHLGFELNDVMGINDHKGRLSMVVEPFFEPLIRPGGFTLGAVLMFHYAYPLSKSLRAFIEGGAGPGYLSKRTREQGSGGFNFFDQGGGGLQIFIKESQALTFGYRFRHISHAGLRDSSNGGINSHFALIGFSYFL